MTSAVEEIDELVAAADSLYINIGTANQPQSILMFEAVRCAARHSKPWVLDPVGVGVSSFRDNLTRKLIAIDCPAVIRCNVSEILHICGVPAPQHGVDAVSYGSGYLWCDDVQRYAQNHRSAVAVSGPADYICYENRTDWVNGGSPLMTKVTGMGCTASAIVAACVAVFPNPFDAAYAGMCIMAEAGSRAADKAQGPASLQHHFLDELSQL